MCWKVLGIDIVGGSRAELDASRRSEGTPERHRQHRESRGQVAACANRASAGITLLFRYAARSALPAPSPSQAWTRVKWCPNVYVRGARGRRSSACRVRGSSGAVVATRKRAEARAFEPRSHARLRRQSPPAGPLFQASACPPFRPPLTKWGSFQWTRSIRL